MDIMQAIAGIPGIGPYLPYLAALITLCAALAPFIPPSAGPLYSIVNFIAMNFGHAKNAGDVPKMPSSSIVILLAAGLAISACNGSRGPTLPQAQAAVGALDAVLQVERATILSASAPDQRAAFSAVMDGVHAAAVGIVGIDPSTATAQQVITGLQGFLNASKTLVADLPIPDDDRPFVAAGVAVVNALLPFVPSMFPPAPVPAPAPAVQP